MAIEPANCRLICAILESRNVSATLAGENLRVSEGGELSPFLWSLVVDYLLWELNSNGYHTVGYADDIAILINGIFTHTVSEVLQAALCTVHKWCEKTKLSINPNKTVIIPFTRKRELKGHREPIIFDHTVQLSNEVKYLGLTLEKGLTRKQQLDKSNNKAHEAFWTCRGTFGKTWGIGPKVVY
jgi:hypothetical protein